MKKPNSEIREEIKRRGVRSYEVANILGHDGVWLSHLLQRPLSPERQQEILKVIDEVAQK